MTLEARLGLVVRKPKVRVRALTLSIETSSPRVSLARVGLVVKN